MSLPAIQEIGITKVYPLKIPAPPRGQYPGIVYQVIRDWPESAADGRAEGHWCQIRISCLARETTGTPGYQAIRTIASAIEGDSNPDPESEPSGLSGWKDDEGNVWLKEYSADGMGTIIEGTDEFEAYVIDQFYRTAYANL